MRAAGASLSPFRASASPTSTSPTESPSNDSGGKQGLCNTVASQRPAPRRGDLESQRASISDAISNRESKVWDAAAREKLEWMNGMAAMHADITKLWAEMSRHGDAQGAHAQHLEMELARQHAKHEELHASLEEIRGLGPFPTPHPGVDPLPKQPAPWAAGGCGDRLLSGSQESRAKMESQVQSLQRAWEATEHRLRGGADGAAARSEHALKAELAVHRQDCYNLVATQTGGLRQELQRLGDKVRGMAALAEADERSPPSSPARLQAASDNRVDECLMRLSELAREIALERVERTALESVVEARLCFLLWVELFGSRGPSKSSHRKMRCNPRTNPQRRRSTRKAGTFSGP